MNPMMAMQLALKEKEMQELIKLLIEYRAKKGSEQFNEKITKMKEILKDENKQIETSNSDSLHTSDTTSN